MTNVFYYDKVSFRRLGKGINQMSDNRQCLECGQYFHYDEMLGDVCIHCFESGDENDDKISKNKD